MFSFHEEYCDVFLVRKHCLLIGVAVSVQIFPGPASTVQGFSLLADAKASRRLLADLRHLTDLTTYIGRASRRQFCQAVPDCFPCGTFLVLLVEHIDESGFNVQFSIAAELCVARLASNVFCNTPVSGWWSDWVTGVILSVMDGVVPPTTGSQSSSVNELLSYYVQAAIL